MIALLALGSATAVTDAQAAGSVQGSMKVSAMVAPISCPAGKNLPSCIKPVETSAQAQHYDVSTLNESGTDPLKLESVYGQLVVVTLTY
jgi:hypothetical protein